MASTFVSGFEWKGLDKSALIFVWRWQTLDEHACERCLALDGSEWQTLDLTPILVHPFFGDVYDLETDQSLMHPNCRCYLDVDVQVDLEKLPLVANLSKEIDGVMKAMPSNIREAISDLDNLNEKVLMLDLTSRQLLRVFRRITYLLERAGLNEDVEKKIQEAQRLAMVMQQLLMSMAFLQMGTPYGFIMGLTGFALAATSGMESQSR